MVQLLRRQTEDPGGSAERAYRARYRSWRTRTRLIALLATLPVLFVMAASSLVEPAHRSLYFGVGLGSTVTLVLASGLAAPEHVDRWRRGAEAEKRTARELARLEPSGWKVLHDLVDARGTNRDHVVVAPSGKVFLLDTKAPSGIVSVERGVLRIRWLEHPDDGYERDLTPRMKGAAASLSRDLSAELGYRPWVTPVVVIWGRWTGSPHIHDDVAWVHGEVLADRLVANAGLENPPLHSRIAAALDSLRGLAASRART
jgi:Nuclease-related domain